MTMYAARNGSSEAELEFEATHYSNLEAEWETHESSNFSNPYSNPEEEWESHETSHEASHFSNPYSNPEEEWETPEASHYSNPYSNPEEEWETHEASHFSNPYSNPEQGSDRFLGGLGKIIGSFLGEEETEWETPEASHYSNPYSNPEEEWESHETSHEASHYSNPYSNLEEEWETPEASPYSNPYSSPEAEWEADKFLPFLPLAAKFALPLLKKAGMGLVKKLVRRAPRMINNVVRNVMRPRPRMWRPGNYRPGYAPGSPTTPGYRPPTGPSYSPGGSVPGYSPTPAPGYGPGTPATPGYVRPGRRRRPLNRQTVSGLFRQLSRIFGEGESEAAAHEASFFGANEFEGEIAAHEAAHEAALTEVMAAEASHTESESEAEAILGTSLPITIRIMGARRVLRPLTPALAQANARLVQGLHRQGPAGRQLVRLVPTIQRRTIASLKAAQRQGRPLTPALVSQIMAGQTARVLGNPQTCGRALVRNMAIRQGTVRRPNRRVAL